jgi:hypothetical protein
MGYEQNKSFPFLPVTLCTHFPFQQERERPFSLREGVPGEKGKKGKREKKQKNIQQQVFAGGHPPNY